MISIHIKNTSHTSLPPIQYVIKAQHVVEPDTSSPLTKYQIKHVQDIIGTLLYYGRAVNPTIVTALSEIASCHSKGIEALLNIYHQLLDYVTTHPNSAIRYHASETILELENDAYYLSEHCDKIRAAAYMTRVPQRVHPNSIWNNQTCHVLYI